MKLKTPTKPLQLSNPHWLSVAKEPYNHKTTIKINFKCLVQQATMKCDGLNKYSKITDDDEDDVKLKMTMTMLFSGKAVNLQRTL